VQSQSLHPCDGVSDCWTMKRGHPPECDVRICQAGEPFLPALHHSGVCGVVNEVPQRAHILPYREIDDDTVVVIRPHGRGISLVRLETPHEPRGRFGERVDRCQVRDELGHHGIGQWRNHTGDVDLGELKSRAWHVQPLQG
jgi:hypothetical protein